MSTKKPSGIPFSIYSEKTGQSLYYYCTPADPKLELEGLDELLSERWQTFYTDEEDDHHIPEPGMCDPTNLGCVLESIKTSQEIFITFGAGLSAGYVPTLIEFLDKLGLEKVTSWDSVTDESMDEFKLKLWQNPEQYINIVNKYWGRVRSLDLSFTPAHQALSDLIYLCQRLGKKVSVYTDNIDDIHNKVGISLARTPLEKTGEDAYSSYIMYPSKTALAGKKSTVLVCGQSFDYDGVLSSIYNTAEDVEFYSFNIRDNSIVVFEGVDLWSILNNPPESFPEIKPTSLSMKLIKSSCHDSIPALTKYLYQFATSISGIYQSEVEHYLSSSQLKEEEEEEEETKEYKTAEFCPQYMNSLKQQNVYRDPTALSFVINELKENKCKAT